MNKELIELLRQSIKQYPAVVPFLMGRARWFAYSVGGFKIRVNHIGGVLDLSTKTYDYFLTVLERLIRSVYSGLLGGEFIDIMANLVQGQLMQAYEQAWLNEGNLLPLPDFLREAAEAKILGQFDYVDQFFRDIVDAKVDGTSIEPLLARAKLWANRFNEAMNDAKMLIAAEMGEKLMWKLGEAEHCSTCLSLSGKVAYASEWVQSGWQPQSQKLECHGFNCQCSLEPTTQRRSPNVLSFLTSLRRSPNVLSFLTSLKGF